MSEVIAAPKPKNWKVFDHYELDKFIRATRPISDADIFSDFPAFAQTGNDSIYRVWNEEDSEFGSTYNYNTGEYTERKGMKELLDYIWQSLGLEKDEVLKIWISW